MLCSSRILCTRNHETVDAAGATRDSHTGSERTLTTSPAELVKVTTSLLRRRRPLCSPPLPSAKVTWRKKKRSSEKANELRADRK